MDYKKWIMKCMLQWWGVHIQQYSTDQHEFSVQGCFISNLFPGTFESVADCQWDETHYVSHSLLLGGYVPTLFAVTTQMFSLIGFILPDLYLLAHHIEPWYTRNQGSCTTSKWALRVKHPQLQGSRFDRELTRTFPCHLFSRFLPPNKNINHAGVK